ncbi:hypothetical protein AVEN_202315-1 [Araneus ventricosus]|uniref:Uncharacterized protein n=1 Tax=Araneus ventricosus TaxID=182803 RepID=A0A4Y2E7L7_ARAVE|nr:hypothetical protein AVEN_202315-1 [Araneus ventricosus]
MALYTKHHLSTYYDDLANNQVSLTHLANHVGRRKRYNFRSTSESLTDIPSATRKSCYIDGSVEGRQNLCHLYESEANTAALSATRVCDRYLLHPKQNPRNKHILQKSLAFALNVSLKEYKVLQIWRI